MNGMRAEIRSGEFGDPGRIQGYKAEQLGNILVERVIWREPAPELNNGAETTGPGYVWFRFWLPRFDQVVERYYTAQGELVGTRVDLCMSLAREPAGWRALDLIMDLWIDPGGAVTLHHEDAYERAVAGQALSDAEARHAEEHLRSLTTAIAQSRFPPAMVRNWQIDLERIRADADAA